MSLLSRKAFLTSLGFAAGSALVGGPATAQDKVDEAATDREALEKAFAEKLSGCIFEGAFTLTGQDLTKLTTEKYTISEVRKLEGDQWVFKARIQYGNHDVAVPITLDVLWAGDTPVITLTKLMIPRLGTFTSRVLVYGNDYAGTWDGGDHGGHLFGRISALPTEELKKASS